MLSLGLPAKEQAVALLTALEGWRNMFFLTLQTDSVFAISNSRYSWNQGWIVSAMLDWRVFAMLQTLRGWNFQIFKKLLEEWLGWSTNWNGKKIHAFFTCLLRLCPLLGFWPFEATKKKKFRFFRHNRLDGAQEWRWPFRYRFCGYKASKFWSKIHQRWGFFGEISTHEWIHRGRFF